jgi:hypothetical protein
LNIQSTPRTTPRLLMTNVGPTSRIHASSLDISTTRIASGSKARALMNWARETPTVTGSLVAIAAATVAKACWAGLAPCRQPLVRSGQSIQQPAWGSNSPGMRNSSDAGVVLSVVVMPQC